MVPLRGWQDTTEGFILARRTLASPRARLYETVRSAHLERAHLLRPAAIVYRTRRYDFDESLTDGLELVQASPLEAARLVVRSRLEALEVNEPLMLSSVKTTALALAGMRWGRPGVARPLIVTYAIGNADPFAERPGSVRGRIRRRLELALARFVWRRVDRIVFGTEAAREVYVSVLGPRMPAESTVIPALPARIADAESAPRGESVVFLGAFAERKGLPLVLEAWPLVTRDRPQARLLLVGKGALEEDARGLAAVDPSVEVVTDPPRDDIRSFLARSRVLVLPSQPHRGWREQVGLPIVEGLEQGCRIVTTDETGLASWLAAHGHSVVPALGAAEALAAAIVAQLDRGDGGALVTRDLPERDGRLAADDWLLEPVSPPARR